MPTCKRRPTARSRSARTAKAKALSRRATRSCAVRDAAGPASRGDSAACELRLAGCPLGLALPTNHGNLKRRRLVMADVRIDLDDDVLKRLELLAECKGRTP